MKTKLRQFANSIEQKFSSSISGEPEDQIRAPFETLIEQTGTGLGLFVTAIGETVLHDNLGKPDYGIAVGGVLCGHVELKAPGKGSDTSKYKGHDKRQWERFCRLPNILYTDSIEWSLYRSGNLIRTARLSGNPCSQGEIAVLDTDATHIFSLISDFLAWKPVVPSTAKQLALYLAPLCRMLKDDVLDALKRGSSTMQGVARDWRNYLFPDADNEKFADSYAQTVTFALLLARSNGANTLFLDEAVNSLSAKNTLLGRALQVLTDDEVQSDVKASLEMLKRVINEIPSHTMTKGKRDPWLHFYEDFLQEYDPKLRKAAGAYYTPLQVVHAQVRIVGDILRTKMNKPMGFAEGGVTTLDPSVGTGTYLLAVVEEAMPRVIAEEGDGAAKARASLLAQNLFGFEIMVGPYAVAALRMTRLLQDFGAGIPGDGVQVFLNNTLESPHERIPEWPMMYSAIGKEHQRAKRVKESVPVLVCLGNPPYGRHEKATDSNKMGTGAWVRWGESKDGADAIFNDFIDPVKRAGKGGKLKNIYNLYAYFWRWGLWKVFEQPFAQTGGVVAFITGSSFLDGDAFLGMRCKMRELCDEIWVIDLGGDGRGTQRDDNVFVIKTPVAITIAVRYEQPLPSTPAKVHYTRINGTRSEKLEALDKIHMLSDLKFLACAEGWEAPFRVRDYTSQYFEWPKLTDLMPWQHSGSQFKRNWPIAPTEQLLIKRWGQFLKSTDRAIAFRESRDRNISSIVRDILDPNTELEPLKNLGDNEKVFRVSKYGFRSFDRQYVLSDSRLGDYLRPSLWQINSQRQIYFTTTFSQTITIGPALTVSIEVPDLHCFNARGAKDIIPLFRDASASQVNIHPELLSNINDATGLSVTADDWACYLYGVMAHAGYSKVFQAELTAQNIRVPVTLEPELFQRAIALGKQLIFLHSYGERFASEFPRLTGDAKCSRSVQMGAPVNLFKYNESSQTLTVGDGEFDHVSPDVWWFEVSGLKVLPSWLSYRMATHSGKKSSPLDDIGLTEWDAGLTTELLKLLWILEKTLHIYPEQAALLDKIRTGKLLRSSALSEPQEAFKKAPKNITNQVKLEFGE